ncbi:pyruvate kinase [Raphidocelis subcapitata]|uniref:Pyruvate kinase n=1 Tax=Raphidocelis subcapitata TaxID=307507 RepID=A0A2V0NZV6_9CHLO|nr:pyruvate kinase [Raphidocelis subcapitata]|eukprot:GBF93146.1 pyruvate kinase [Raphidocelis subcapitata]
MAGPSLALKSFFTPADPDLAHILEEAHDTVPASTKLVCTIGAVSRDVDTLCELLEAGMTSARFDFSFGNVEFHQEGLNNLREAMARTGKLCASIMDTLGPEIVVLNRTAEPIALTAGQTLTLACSTTAKASATLLPISYPSLTHAGLQPGRHIFVGQYLFTGSETTSAYLTVQSVSDDGQSVECLVGNSCVLEGVQLTVHFGNMSNQAPILGDRDKAALKAFGAPNAIDYVALSFTRCADDVRAARSYLDSIGMGGTKIIAKIENKEGLLNHTEIIPEADAIILSRGSMGNCLDPEKMFMAQKMLLSECNFAGVPILATRVMDTMTDAPRPTRAEATDVANLVLDGADGIVLGSETFRGKFPVAAAETVVAICRQAEFSFDSYRYYQYVTDRMGLNSLDALMKDKTEALATAAVRAATKLRAALIVVFTVTGRTARLIAKYRPAQPVLTLVMPPGWTPCQPATSSVDAEAMRSRDDAADAARAARSRDAVARQCLQYRGVLPVAVDTDCGDRRDGPMLHAALQMALERGLTRPGDRVVVSQCPRKTQRYSSIMEETGVVKILTLGADGVSTRVATAVLDSAGHVVGSREEDEADLV